MKSVTPSRLQTRLDQEHNAARRLCIPGGTGRLRDAAEQGQIAAQAELGRAYLYGLWDLPTESDKAAYWLTLAAERGDMYAQADLADMYEKGQPFRWYYHDIKEVGTKAAPGIPQDYPRALAWYRRCADQGYIRCQGELSGMYGLGNGTPKDRKQSYYWELIAAQSGGEFFKKYMYLAEEQLSRQDIDEVRHLAEKWHPVLEYPLDPTPSH
jgi:TPR repeat protein